MGNLYHDACTVARLVARLSTSMLHIFEHLKGIVDQLVALSAVDIDDHTHTARIVFIITLVESLAV